MGDFGCSSGDTHMDTSAQWVTVAVVLRYTYEYTWPVGESGCSAGVTHMDIRGEWVTVAAVLAIHVWKHVASG